MPVSVQKADFYMRSKVDDMHKDTVDDAVEDGEIEDTVDERATKPSHRRPSVVDSEASSRPGSPIPAANTSESPPADSPPVEQTSSTATDMATDGSNASMSPTLRQSSTPEMTREEEDETASSRSESQSPPPGLNASESQTLKPTVHIMSAENLDLAKDIVLDLLGWGVSPEYLVDCGVSPQSIYQIFADLRLQLPQNLVV